MRACLVSEASFGSFLFFNYFRFTFGIIVARPFPRFFNSKFSIAVFFNFGPTNPHEKIADPRIDM